MKKLAEFITKHKNIYLLAVILLIPVGSVMFLRE